MNKKTHILLTTNDFEQAISQAETLEDLVRILDRLLCGRFNIWKDGRLYIIKELVAQVNGLKIEIMHREHAPPHFHVKAAEINAQFTIEDCKLLKGEISRRHRDIIEWFHQKSKEKLINIWNRTRPDDCPVGPIKQ